MKKNKKILKPVVINKYKGIGKLYNNYFLALFGVKKNRNKIFNKTNYSINNSVRFNNEFNKISAKQNTDYMELEQFNMKLISMQINNKTYKGARILAKLPLRGQRTHTNAKTSRKLLNKLKID